MRPSRGPTTEAAKRELLGDGSAALGLADVVRRWPWGSVAAACVAGFVLARSAQARRAALPIILAALRQG
ncbi:MAG: hypothetical protein ACKVW3_15145 [Phycisphaerales bacterium]